SVVLNLEPDRNIMVLAESAKELDSIQLEAALCKHSSGIYLLPGPKRIEDAETITPGQVGAAVDLMRQLFDFVVVDCGRNIDETAIAVWERSDHLFYVLDQSLTAVRSAARFLDLFERLNLSGIEPSLALTRAEDLRKVAPHSPLTKSLEDFVRRVAGAIEPQVEQRGGLFARLFANG